MLDDLLHLEWHAREAEEGLKSTAQEQLECRAMLLEDQARLEELRRQFAGLTNVEHRRDLDEQYHQLWRAVTTAEHRCLSLEHQHRIWTENVAAITAEAAAVQSRMGNDQKEALEALRVPLQQAYTNIRAMADMCFVADAPSPLPHCEWEARQQEWRAQARESLQHRYELIIACLNSITLYDAPACCEAWSHLVHRMSLKMVDALRQALTTSFRKVAAAVHGTGPELFAVTLRLNPASRLSFSPLITDLQGIVAFFCERILACVQGLDYLHAKLKQPAVVGPCFQHPDLFTMLRTHCDVQWLLNHIRMGCRAFPDRVAEWLMGLEDEYRVGWTPGRVGQWKHPRKCEAYLAKLTDHWDPTVHLDFVVIDTTPLQQALTKVVWHRLNLLKERSDREDGEAHSSSDTDSENASESDNESRQSARRATPTALATPSPVPMTTVLSRPLAAPPPAAQLQPLFLSSTSPTPNPTPESNPNLIHTPSPTTSPTLGLAPSTSPNPWAPKPGLKPSRPRSPLTTPHIAGAASGRLQSPPVMLPPPPLASTPPPSSPSETALGPGHSPPQRASLAPCAALHLQGCASTPLAAASCGHGPCHAWVLCHRHPHPQHGCRYPRSTPRTGQPSRQMGCRWPVPPAT